MSDIDALVSALDPLAWIDATPLYPYGRLGRRLDPIEVGLRCVVRPSLDADLSTATAVRRHYYTKAEEIIATAERLGWTYASAPRIEVDGQMGTDDKGHRVPMQIRCEVRLAFFAPENAKSPRAESPHRSVRTPNGG